MLARDGDATLPADSHPHSSPVQGGVAAAATVTAAAAAVVAAGVHFGGAAADVAMSPVAELPVKAAELVPGTRSYAAGALLCRRMRSVEGVQLRLQVGVEEPGRGGGST